MYINKVYKINTHPPIRPMSLSNQIQPCTNGEHLIYLRHVLLDPTSN